MVPARFSNGLEFDQYVVKYYQGKMQSCRTRNIDFKLNLAQVKNLLRAKTCPVLGLAMSHTGANGKGDVQQPHDVTIDRLDSSKPYETGNVIAISKMANSAKNGFECVLGGRDTIKTIHILSKLLKKKGFV